MVTSKKFKLPKQLASERPPKKRYGYFLDVANVEYLEEQAAISNVSVSALVDEAIRAYVEAIKLAAQESGTDDKK